MIDWPYVGFNSLWVLGAGLLLAVLAIAVFTSSEEKQNLRILLSDKGYSLFINIGFLLICVGLCALTETWWQKLFWGVLGFGFLLNAWLVRTK
jgi:hypothetical protein